MLGGVGDEFVWPCVRTRATLLVIMLSTFYKNMVRHWHTLKKKKIRKK